MLDSSIREALDVARGMIEHGIPIFAAPPCPAAHGGRCSRPGHNGREEFDLPAKWQLTVPSEVWLERWEPGWGLAAVGGHLADFLDVDPRSGGGESLAALERAGHLPRIYGAQGTPSGGQHLMIAALGEHKATPLAPDLPGLDYQGGAPDGTGRGFVWIAPTIKRSKAAATLGQRLTYRWEQVPDLDWLSEGGDESGEMLVSRIRAARTSRKREMDDRTERPFTVSQAKAFCDLTLEPLKKAQIGEIEEKANNAACALSHFVPEVFSAEFAFNALTAALGETAYDPEHPAAAWTAEKFRPVIAGENGRAPADWKAVKVEEQEQPPADAQEVMDAAAEAEPDEVEALLAEMLTLGQVKDRPPKAALIQGLLHLDSESWLIGAPGSMKSFVALSLAMHVADGREWLGRRVTAGPVVIIAAEGAAGMTNRVKAWEKRFGWLPPDQAVRVLPRPVQVSNAGAWATLVAACERLKPVLVIVDTQHRVTAGLDENAARDAGFYIAAAGAVRLATGACVLTVHHTGRNGQDARGSSAIDGAQDSELKVVRGQGKLQASLKIEKQKDMEELEPITLHFERIELGEDEHGDAQSSLVLLPPDAWRDSAGPAVEAVDPGQVERIPDPVRGDWTWVAFDHHKADVKRYVLMTLATVGGQVGRTESQVQKVVLERWFGGRPVKANEAGYLAKATWDKAWTAVVDYVTPGGEQIVAGTGSARYAINPVAVSELGGNVLAG